MLYPSIDHNITKLIKKSNIVPYTEHLPLEWIMSLLVIPFFDKDFAIYWWLPQKSDWTDFMVMGWG